MSVGDEAEILASQLRAHFIANNSNADVSTLIARSRNMSARLKMEGQIKSANKFDSYTDVLMYGNHTLDESIRDVMDLVKNGYCPGENLIDYIKASLGCRPRVM